MTKLPSVDFTSDLYTYHVYMDLLFANMAKSKGNCACHLEKNVYLNLTNERVICLETPLILTKSLFYMCMVGSGGGGMVPQLHRSPTSCLLKSLTDAAWTELACTSSTNTTHINLSHIQHDISSRNTQGSHGNQAATLLKCDM